MTYTETSLAHLAGSSVGRGHLRWLSRFGKGDDKINARAALVAAAPATEQDDT